MNGRGRMADSAARYLERAGYPVRDTESDYLDLQTQDDDAMATLIGASSEAALVRHPGRSYRLAFGPNAGLGAPDETNDVTDHTGNDNNTNTWRISQQTGQFLATCGHCLQDHPEEEAGTSGRRSALPVYCSTSDLRETIVTGVEW